MQDPLIRIENLTFAYNAQSERPIVALKDIDLTIGQGEYLAIVGHNGSGKSTLAKHSNALLLPTQGDVWVAGWNTKDPAHIRDIRSTVGMVFQVPDNQIVATVVEEDVAFGPENLGVAEEELEHRVTLALGMVGLLPLRKRAPHLLSAGQKQRLAIAGALAMRPRCLVLDEATALLDPRGRAKVSAILRHLREEGVTIVAITHLMSEAAEADRVLVLDKGRVAMEGSPRQVFRQVEALRALKLDVPPATELALTLSTRLPGFPPDLLTVPELVEAVWERMSR
jgi:energy-coupling factor transporter ATPase